MNALADGRGSEPCPPWVQRQTGIAVLLDPDGLDDVEQLVVPAGLAPAFDRHPGSAEQWQAFPRSARRGVLEWIVQARTVTTRSRCPEQTAQPARRDQRANQWRPRSSGSTGADAP